MLHLILGILGGALAGLLTALRVIAPLTKTTKDDKVLEIAEKVQDTAGPLLK